MKVTQLKDTGFFPTNGQVSQNKSTIIDTAYEPMPLPAFRNNSVPSQKTSIFENCPYLFASTAPSSIMKINGKLRNYFLPILSNLLFDTRTIYKTHELYWPVSKRLAKL